MRASDLQPDRPERYYAMNPKFPFSMLRAQNGLDLGAHGAHTIMTMMWLFVLVLGVIFTIAIAILLISLGRQHHAIGPEPLEGAYELSIANDGRLTRVVDFAAGAALLILLGLIVVGVTAGSTL
jgi:hypothetical protein